jgi:hypothetical protein
MRDVLRALLAEHARTDGCNKRAAIRDFLTDLRHIAAEQGVNINDAIEGSEAVYNEEVELASLNASTIEHVNPGGK